MATIPLRTPTTSVDLSAELAQVTGWGVAKDGKPHTQFFWMNQGGIMFRLLPVTSARWLIPRRVVPAFDMGYLLRNTPSSIMFEPFKVNFLTINKLANSYVCYYADPDGAPVSDEYSAPTSEDALGLLVVGMVRKNIFKVESGN